jgi:hypothetical protein
MELWSQMMAYITDKYYSWDKRDTKIL